MSDDIVIKRFSKDEEKALLSCGVPPADLPHTKERVDVLDSLTKYEVELPKMAIRLVSANRQATALQRVLSNPIRSHYTMGISSFPSDALAKHLAAYVMNEAIKAWRVKHRPGRTLPKWHRVFGGLSDPLRDKPLEETPSLLVLSNINEASSNYKLEKVRDLLERYSHIPKIVVLSGADPITFFATKLYAPLNVGLYLGPNNRVKEA